MNFYSIYLIVFLSVASIAGNANAESWFERTGLIQPEIKEVRVFRFAVITDSDDLTQIETLKNGKLHNAGLFVAYLREGILTLTRTSDGDRPFNLKLEMDEDRIHKIQNHEVLSKLGYGGRGMELSTLVKFDDKLLSCDDKTGVVYDIPLSKQHTIYPIPWLILADGNYTGPQGFKCEWSTVKDGLLIIGGHGTNDRSRYVKVITPEGSITHVNWFDNFQKIQEAFSIHSPGYVTHEAIKWSEILGKWIMLPRKLSNVSYTDEEYEKAGSNLYMLADEDFENFEVKEIGDLNPTHGFSAVAFVPTTDDFVVVALKSVEVDNDESWGNEIATYIMAFDLAGNILFPETKFAAQKYEGLIFLGELENSD